MSDDGESDDIDIVSISREEAHRTIDNQIQTLDDIDSKAAKILRINLVILGILLTGVSLATTPGSASDGPIYYADLVNRYTIGGTVLLLVSTGVAAITYTSSSLQAGVGPDDLRAFLDNDYSDRQNLEGLVAGYAEWIEYNYKTNAKNAPLGTLTLLLLIFAMTALALGTKKAATGDVEWWLLLLTVFLLLLVIHSPEFALRSTDIDGFAEAKP
jgi:hypothetical protein